MEWFIKRFDQLSIDDLYDILHLRNQIFVVEQDCVYQDCDYKDKQSYHLYARDKDGKVVVCLRIVDKGVSYKEVSIGRFVSSQSVRGSGFGREAISRAIDFIENTLKETGIRISGQAYLEKFYNNMGFKSCSELYNEDGIPHYEMFRSGCDRK